MTKKEARERGLAARDALGAAARAEKDARIRERLFGERCWREAACVLLYLSFGTEADTWAIAARALEEKKSLFCPRITDRQSGRMAFYRTDPSRTRPGIWGIREPEGEELFNPRGGDARGETLIVLPGAAFSPAGERIGYGGGFYDRYLAASGDLMNRTALCYDCQVMEKGETDGAFPAEETDARVGRIVTESRTIVCG